jgi:molybdopterin/thiamine biosynthesis adenylyltransferase/rhodanese-related sulfurtransferase
VDEPPRLSNEEVGRYSRHLLIPEIGEAGQAALKAASVLVVGAGGLGSPAAMYLAAAGVGTIGIADDDAVDLSNLQRQLLHRTADIGRPKTDSARETIAGINPNVSVRTFPERLDSGNALRVLADFDVILDGTDNFPTRYLLNDACVLLGLPNVYGSVFRYEGQVSVFAPNLGGPCYRCLYPEPPPPGVVPSCAEGGVLGVLPGVIGTLQALAAINLLTAQTQTLIGRLLLFDGLAMSFRELTLRKDPDCPVCGANPTVRSLIDYEDFCGVSKPAGVPAAGGEGDISVEELKSRLDQGRGPLLLDVREPRERAICSLGGVLIPQGELPNRLSELDPSKEIVVYCRTGRRSAAAVEFLKRSGFRNPRNLAGGVTAWADRIDPSMPKY